jgi:hypothetical protein
MLYDSSKTMYIVLEARKVGTTMLALYAWQNFFILVGTASATLIGLLFIAISIGSYIPAQKAKEYTRTFVTPILFVYAQVLFVSCLALMPLGNVLLFSGVLVGLGVLDLFFTGKIIWRIRVVHRDDTDIEPDYWLWYILLPGMLSLLLIASAPGLLFDEPLTVPVIAVIALLSLATGLRNTWNLMFWLMMRRGVKQAESEHLREKASME